MAKKKQTTNDAVAKHAVHNIRATDLVYKPRITEKATQVAEKNVYTFTVAPNATKTQIKEAIQTLYKVTPVRINVVTMLAKQVLVRGKRGTTAGGRKAYVFLKKGDTINLM